MMKVLLLIGLLALVEAKWVHSDSPLQSVNERELLEEGSQLQALLLRNLLRNLHKFDGKKEHSAENNGSDSLEDHSSEDKQEEEPRLVPNDSPLQSISDGESVDKGSQYEEHDISKLLRNLHKSDDKKKVSAENKGPDSMEDDSSEVKQEDDIRWIPNDSPLQSISDGESVDKGSQYEEHDISKLLRNLHKFDDKKKVSAENKGPDSMEDDSSEVKQEDDTRWIPNDSPLQSITDGESVDKGRQYEEHDISKLLRNLHKFDDKKDLSAENKGPDSLEDHSSEVKHKGEAIRVPNDRPLQSITAGESVDKGSHDISKFLRSIEERLVNQEIDWADSLRNRKLENYAKAHHINDDSPGKRADIELLASLAQQANDAGIQRDLDEYGRLAVGEPVSNQGFMDIQNDNQPMDEKLSRY